MTNRYLDFLPERWRRIAESVEPESTWWDWPMPPSRTRAAGAVAVHIARARRPDAAVRVMVVHGMGGHSGLVWPLAAILADQGCEVLAPDLPLYGHTTVEHSGRLRYDDWPAMLIDLVVAETDADPRPLVLFGASVGGMLCYEVAHRTGRAAAVVATCLLEIAGNPDVIRRVTRHPVLAWTAPLVRAVPPVLDRLRIPVTWFAPIRLMSKNSDLSRLCAEDPQGAAARLPLRLIADMLTHVPAAPESYRGAPVTLLHPGSDRWTPPELSMRFADRIAGDVDVRLLTDCGHFPVEEPGVEELAVHVRALLAQACEG